MISIAEKCFLLPDNVLEFVHGSQLRAKARTYILGTDYRNKFVYMSS